MKSIKYKILLGFSVVIFLTLLLGGFNFFAIKNSNEETRDMIDRQVPLLIADEKLAFNVSQGVALARGYVLYGNEEYKESFNRYTQDSIKVQEEILTASNSQEIKSLIDTSELWREIIVNEVFTAYDNGDVLEAQNILATKVQPIAQGLIDGFEKLAQTREDKIKDDGQQIIQNGSTVFTIGLIISILSIILGVVAAIITSRMITAPIKTVMDRMKLIASGDLSQKPLKSNSKDEVGQLVEATNQMNERIRELLSKISTVSESVTGQSEELTQSANEVKEGSEQVASTMQELSAGSESQANTAGDLSSAMDSFSAKVQEANSNGEHIHHTSNNVLQKAEEGTKLMDLSVQQMATIDQIVQDAVQKVKGLDQRSKDVSKLVFVIKNVAEQTNLLALNASIEAARAGEHGKGFAVVAEEVRKLAEQVTQSVKEITGIVNAIQTETGTVTQSLQAGYEEVEKGTAQIKTTGQTFTAINSAVNEMVQSIQGISSNLADIAKSNLEMNKSIEEIAAISEESAAGIEQTSASVQQTNSSMEEVAGSADQLAKLAEELNDLIGQFKL
ncbi:methyl-accepting chemotaxis protein [Bacillus carboniphilus]|uniref:Methyl-accepting chemotaxis protein n=1 Tax=Bacillus carboniphilus TaxID=86663 RepID=A0ABN0VT89_9BACI